jgi:hypothetical protein
LPQNEPWMTRSSDARGNSGTSMRSPGGLALDADGVVRAILPGDRELFRVACESNNLAATAQELRVLEAVSRRQSDRLYGSIRLRPLFSPGAALHTLLWNAHHYLALAFFALILLHLAAALFMRWHESGKNIVTQDLRAAPPHPEALRPPVHCACDLRRRSAAYRKTCCWQTRRWVEFQRFTFRSRE